MHTTPETIELDDASLALTRRLLAPFFKGDMGDAPEVVTPRPSKPAPASEVVVAAPHRGAVTRELVEA